MRKNINTFMDMAIEESKKGLNTFTNPKVGCILEKNNKIISKGYHSFFGGPHAEIEAINKAKVDLAGSNMYVTLEPCCHFGKTPPCTDRIIKEKIKNIYIGLKDVNPLVKGKGIEKLEKNGIKVETGFREEIIKDINQAYIKNIRKKMPFIAIKYAMTLDGKIALQNYNSKYITSRSARNYGKSLRDMYDSILVGTNTLIKDNPVLDGIMKKPVKIIIDRKLVLPLNLNIFNNKNIIFMFTSSVNKSSKKILNYKKFINEMFFVEEKCDKLNLSEIFKILFNKNISSILIEGGSEILGEIFDNNLADKIYAFVAYKIFGGVNDIVPIAGKGIRNIDKAKIINKIKITTFENELLIEGTLNNYS